MLRLFNSEGREKIHVRGEDQLFSYAQALHDRVSQNPSGDSGYVQSSAVPSGEVWHVTNIAVTDTTTAVTRVLAGQFAASVDYRIDAETLALAAGDWWTRRTDLWLDVGDRIRFTLTGCLAGDTVTVDILGLRMTLET